jgi:hypothetical protein
MILMAIHFDDYFYPQQTGTGNYNDDASFAADPRGFTNRNDWRRDNVNLLIKRAYERIKELKSWVKFGISPSGIYRNSTNPAIGTNTSGLEHYTSLYADSKKWLEQQWVDYIAPQVYWYMGQPGANYSVIVPWWNSIANGRHIYIGMAGYKVNDPAQGANWANPSQIPNEVRFNRTFANVSGQAIYNTNSLRSATTLGFRDSLRLNFYRKPALLPTMLWRDATPPSPASNLTALKYANDSVVLNWVKPANTSNELDKAKRFVIYRSENPVIDITNANNILAITNNDTAAYADKTIAANTTYYYTVTALDRFQNESETTNNAANIPPAISCPGNQQLFATTSCSVALPDYNIIAQVENAGAAKGIIITQTPVAGTLINAGNEIVVSVSVKDAAGNSNSCSFNVKLSDTISPVITTCASDKTVNTSKGICGALVDAGAPVVTDNCSVTSIVGTRSDAQPLNAVYPTGTTTINWVATDAAGNTATCSQTITVVDNEAPVISSLSVNPAKLNSPNHKMHDVTVSYKATDNCGIASTVLSVTSNEPENGLGDGDTDHDWEIIDDHHVQLRAERCRHW